MHHFAAILVAWGLRDYGTPPQIWGGNPACEHSFATEIVATEIGRGNWAQGVNGRGELQPGGVDAKREPIRSKQERGFCPCGAWLGSLGLEPDYRLYVEHLVEIFREVRRVLRRDGTLWLNLGDCYATGAGKVGERPGGGEQGDRWNGYRGGHKPEDAGKAASRVAAMGPMTQPNRMPQPGLKPKDLAMIPARVAIALQDDGWYLRSDIIWNKPNPMPESVTDRPTTSHEHIFLMTRSERYYYDADAIKETAEYGEPNSPESIKSPHGQAITRRAGHGQSEQDYTRLNDRQDALHSRIGRKGNAKTFRGGGAYTAGQSFNNSSTVERDSHGNKPNETLSRNKRSVWTVATTPFSEAHFATFPPKLIEPCILAGAPPRGVVLDPFLGSGTTLMVADRLGRDGIGIELNHDYAKMAERRCREPGFAFDLATAPSSGIPEPPSNTDRIKES